MYNLYRLNGRTIRQNGIEQQQQIEEIYPNL